MLFNWSKRNTLTPLHILPLQWILFLQQLLLLLLLLWLFFFDTKTNPHESQPKPQPRFTFIFSFWDSIRPYFSFFIVIIELIQSNSNNCWVFILKPSEINAGPNVFPTNGVRIRSGWVQIRNGSPEFLWRVAGNKIKKQFFCQRKGLWWKPAKRERERGGWYDSNGLEQ